MKDPNMQAIQWQQIERLRQLLKYSQMGTEELRRAMLEAHMAGVSPDVIVATVVLK